MAKYIQDIRQGDSRTIRINYGTGFDITGWTFYFIMKSDLDLLNNDLEAQTTAGSHPDDDPTNGIVNIIVPANLTANLQEGSYYYSIKRNDNAVTPNVKTILPPIEDYKDRIKVVKALKIV